ncbi:hypothetical protein Arub01_23360 [Actinomadura rubrobrunea]|uniref:Uncharacterized protein n=1 Tax=Actinomadura rubrobrunea TaxID=115335 RepID=A0A9W6PWJ3_9ACTN|nr:hypothetical protein [Actinomadura rubrobrunea]GLW64092.1 hypothetical protein Arub01_23360 [Actinomadura rubrobrunea]
MTTNRTPSLVGTVDVDQAAANLKAAQQALLRARDEAHAARAAYDRARAIDPGSPDTLHALTVWREAELRQVDALAQLEHARDTLRAARRGTGSSPVPEAA